MNWNRRMTDNKNEDGSGDAYHFNITQQNVRDIGEIKTDIAGLKIGMDGLGKEQSAGFANQSQNLNRVIQQLSLLSTPKEDNWVAIGSLIIGVVVVFGSIFGFLFYAQSNTTQEALLSMQRESDLRQENLSRHVFRMEDEMVDRNSRQDDLNMEFIQNK